MTTAPHSGRDRHPDDWYIESKAAVSALLMKERIYGPVLDPCCGWGTIPRVLEAHSIDAFGTDLVGRTDLFPSGIDFLGDNIAVRYHGWPRCIVFNPPYAKAQLFVEKALASCDWKVCALLPLSFLEGVTRFAWFTRPAGFVLSRVHVFSDRISMPPGDAYIRGLIRREGGKRAFAWFVWDRDHQGRPEISFMLAREPNTLFHEEWADPVKYEFAERTSR